MEWGGGGVRGSPKLQRGRDKEPAEPRDFYLKPRPSQTSCVNLGKCSHPFT